MPCLQKGSAGYNSYQHQRKGDKETSERCVICKGREFLWSGRELKCWKFYITTCEMRFQPCSCHLFSVDARISQALYGTCTMTFPKWEKLVSQMTCARYSMSQRWDCSLDCQSENDFQNYLSISFQSHDKEIKWAILILVFNLLSCLKPNLWGF